MRCGIAMAAACVIGFPVGAAAEVEPHAKAAEAYNDYVEAYKKKDMTAAEASLKKAIAAQPEWGQPYLALGELYKAQKNYPAAARQFEEGTKRLPADARALMSLGDAYRLQDQYSKAFGPLERALALDTGLVEASLLLATAYYDAGQYAAAVTHFDHYTARRRDDGQTFLRLADANKKLKRRGAAIAACKAAIRAEPKLVAAHYNLGNLYLEDEDFEGAEEAFAAAVKFEPDNFKAQFNLAIAIHSQGRLADALAAYEKVVAIGGSRSAARGTVASAKETIKGLKEQLAAGGQ